MLAKLCIALALVPTLAYAEDDAPPIRRAPDGLLSFDAMIDEREQRFVDPELFGSCSAAAPTSAHKHDKRLSLDPAKLPGMKKTHQGSCHCGAVRFEADVDLAEGGSMCNCTACQKLAVFSVKAKPADLRVLSGEGNVGRYEWGGKIGQRYFCLTCGAQTFMRGDLAEMGGPFASININCLDDVDPSTLPVRYWDGRHNNWQAGTRSTPWPYQPQV